MLCRGAVNVTARQLSFTISLLQTLAWIRLESRFIVGQDRIRTVMTGFALCLIFSLSTGRHLLKKLLMHSLHCTFAFVCCGRGFCCWLGDVVIQLSPHYYMFIYALLTHSFLACIVTFQITKPGNVETVKIFSWAS